MTAVQTWASKYAIPSMLGGELSISIMADDAELEELKTIFKKHPQKLGKSFLSALSHVGVSVCMECQHLAFESHIHGR